MENTPELEKNVFDALVQSAKSPGIVEVDYGFMGYQIPGFTEVAGFLDSCPLMDALAHLEGGRHIEFVQDKNNAIVYIPRYLLITTDENRMRADQLRLMPYPDYLETWEWVTRRRLARLRDDNACTNCGLCVDVREMHVHHRTYERRGIERLDDLRTLCSHCHYESHRWELEGA